MNLDLNDILAQIRAKLFDQIYQIIDDEEKHHNHGRQRKAEPVVMVLMPGIERTTLEFRSPSKQWGLMPLEDFLISAAKKPLGIMGRLAFKPFESKAREAMAAESQKLAEMLGTNEAVIMKHQGRIKIEVRDPKAGYKLVREITRHEFMEAITPPQKTLEEEE